MDKLLGLKVTAIKIIRNKDFKSDNNAVLADKIIIGIENQYIVITPLADTDEINVQIAKKIIQNDSSFLEEIFPQFVGFTLGYTWKAVNSRGYFDCFIIAFGSLKPDLIILSEGSVLKLFLTQQYVLPN